MTAYALEHPWLTFTLAVIVVLITENMACNITNRILRHWNIHKHGLPAAALRCGRGFQE